MSAIHETSTITEAGDYLARIGDLLGRIEFTAGGALPGDLNDGVRQVAQLILDIKGAGRRILLIGNGGSASIAGHTRLDLCNRLRVKAFTFEDALLLTALSNDHGYECVYERGIALWAEPGDCLIAVSSSGRSENILRGVQAARERGASIVTFSGFRPDNPLRQLGDWNFYVGSQQYGEVEVVHHVLGHCLTDLAAIAGGCP